MDTPNALQNLDDQELVQRVQQGDTGAFSILVSRYNRKVYRLAKHITDSDADAEDVLQDTFLNNVRKNKIPLTIFLINGVKLQGIVTWFDNFCVLLRRDGHSQLVYKHAISTIMPAQPVNLMEQDPAEQG